MGNRSDRQRAFFRAVDTDATELFPGDERTVLSLLYCMDDEMFWNDHGSPKDHVYKQTVRVVLNREGLPPLVVERGFEEFTNF